MQSESSINLDTLRDNTEIEHSLIDKNYHIEIDKFDLDSAIEKSNKLKSEKKVFKK